MGFVGLTRPLWGRSCFQRLLAILSQLAWLPRVCEKTDRAALAKVNACLRRAVCQDLDVREGIGRVEGAACESAAEPVKDCPGSPLGQNPQVRTSETFKMNNWRSPS